ncbi:MAG: hypothetical protein WC867_02240 [Candidatus Pacearchaeota archaeon]|jgi:hypothetical protein
MATVDEVTTESRDEFHRVRLEDVCIGHINPRSERCNYCKIDEGNSYCSNYQSRITSIRQSHYGLNS